MNGPTRSLRKSKQRPIAARPTTARRYYEYWLAALERLVTSKGLTDGESLAARKEEWADAYRHTPHGQPVVLHNHDEHGDTDADT